MEPSYPTRITRPPDFADEEWLRQAIHELETRPMTSEERYQLARITAKNAEAIHAEKRRIEEVKETLVINLLQGTNFDTAKIASLADVSVEFVEEVKQKMADTQ